MLSAGLNPRADGRLDREGHENARKPRKRGRPQRVPPLASGDGEPRIHANGRESAPGPQVSHLTPSLRLPHEGVRSARGAGPRPQGSSRPLGSSAPARRLQRRATGNRESTRMDANLPLARRFRTSPPAFGFPLSARGERGGEVGTPSGAIPFVWIRVIRGCRSPTPVALDSRALSATLRPWHGQARFIPNSA